MSDIASIIQELEQRRTAIDNALTALREVGGEPMTKRRGRPPGEKAASDGRQKQAEAMRRYWAARKAAGKKATKKAVQKSGLTAAARKELSEKMKRIWAEKLEERRRRN